MPISIVPATISVPSAEYVRNITRNKVSPEEKVAATLVESFSKTVMISARRGATYQDIKIPTMCPGVPSFRPDIVVYHVSRELGVCGYRVHELVKDKVLRIQWMVED